MLHVSAALQERMIAWRRHLHQHPELSFHEHETTQWLIQQLSLLDLPTRRPSPTGVVADIVGSRPGPLVVLRADIDALPIHEATGLPFASTRPGVMHACGHDGHTSILLGVANLLTPMRTNLAGTIRLLFQAAEEVAPGGALPLVQKGLVDDARAVWGLHLWSGLPSGVAGICPGPMMANTDQFTIRVQGKGGHGGLPHQTLDAIVAAAQLVSALQSVVSRRTNPLRPAVLTIGSLHAGDACNVIADTAMLQGTCRSFDDATRDILEQEVTRVAAGVGSSTGTEIHVTYERGYPAVVNHSAETERLAQVCRGVLGEELVQTIDPVMAGEDFAYYLQRRPGAFLFLGSGNPDIGSTYPHHHPQFTIDEAVLPQGAEILAALALDTLHT